MTYLLSLETGRYVSLDPVGSEVWSRLSGGMSLEQCAEAIADMFAIAFSQALRDVRGFVQDLEKQALASQEHDRLAERGVQWSGVARLLARHGHRVPSVLKCIGLLGWCRLNVRRSHLGALIDWIMSITVNPMRDMPPGLAYAVTRRIRTAAAACPWRTTCLDQGAAIVLMLRWMGFDVHLRFGVHAFPFSTHAWAEHRGVPVSENPDEILRYRPFLEVHPGPWLSLKREA